MAKKRKKWYVFLFTAYGLLMLWLLFGQRWGQNAGGLNLQPLDTLHLFWWVLMHGGSRAQKIHAVVNLAGNVIMFVPLGFLMPCIWERMHKFGWHFLCMVLSILAVELLQLATGLGSCDVDDLILNLVGTTMGFGLYRLWKYVCHKGGS